MRYGIVYLHGFASGPQSEKAELFRAHFASKGVPFVAPRLDGGDFRSMSVSKSLSIVETAAAQIAGDRALVLFGSSYGGLVASLFAEKHQTEGQRPSALVLIAPAFELTALWRRRLGPDNLERWKKAGVLELRENERWVYGPDFPNLNYEFYSDAQRYDGTRFTFLTPTLVFHGAKDTEVPLETSQRFADAQNVQLVVYAQGGHRLSESLTDMRAHIDGFLTARNLVSDRESKQAP